MQRETYARFLLKCLKTQHIPREMGLVQGTTKPRGEEVLSGAPEARSRWQRAGSGDSQRTDTGTSGSAVRRGHGLQEIPACHAGHPEAEEGQSGARRWVGLSARLRSNKLNPCCRLRASPAVTEQVGSRSRSDSRVS